MQSSQKQLIFTQNYLSRLPNLNLTHTSKYQKVFSFTKGVMLRKNKNLYKSQKYWLQDLQTIMNYDAESAYIVFKDIQAIKYTYDQVKKQGKVLVQCNRCGLFTLPYKYCEKCENMHYCSQVCQYNVKLTHQKQQCRIKSYPKIHHTVLIEVHFGTNMGNNIQVYFQHQNRAYALVRGKQIIANLHEYFSKIKKTSDLQERQQVNKNRRGRLQQKLMGFKVQLKNGSKYVEFQQKDEKSYPTGILKVDLEDIDTLKRIYQQNQILQQIQLYFLGEGALMITCSQQIHNNHAHWVYIFRMI